MMKVVLNHISGVDIYAIMSLGFFMSFFCIMLVWVLRLRKPYLNTMQNLPLEETPSL